MKFHMKKIVTLIPPEARDLIFPFTPSSAQSLFPMKRLPGVPRTVR